MSTDDVRALVLRVGSPIAASPVAALIDRLDKSQEEPDQAEVA